jgi:hypothetical protein
MHGISTFFFCMFFLLSGVDGFFKGISTPTIKSELEGRQTRATDYTKQKYFYVNYTWSLAQVATYYYHFKNMDAEASQRKTLPIYHAPFSVWGKDPELGALLGGRFKEEAMLRYR